MNTQLSNELKIRFGLTPKLFFLVLLSFGLLMAVIVWRIGVEADWVADAAIEKSLKQSDIILETTLTRRFAQITETAQSLARDGRILPRLFEQDASTLQDLTSEFKAALEFDILFFIDAEGRILARSDEPEATGKSVAKRDIFNTALQGKIARGMMVSQGQLLQIVAVPVVDNVAHEVVRGIVAVAYALSPAMAKDIHQLTSSEIGFFLYGTVTNAQGEKIPAAPYHQFITQAPLGPVLDAYFKQQPELWARLRNNTHEHSELVIPIGEDQYHAVIYPLLSSGGGALGFIVAVRSRAELTRPFVMIQRQVWIVGGACLVMASLIAWGLAGRIARPIIRLVSVTKAIQNGQFQGGNPDYIARDEVGLLYQAVYRMGKELKEKAELEAYLAQLGEIFEGEDSDDAAVLAAAEASLHQSLSRVQPVLAAVPSGFNDGDTIPDSPLSDEPAEKEQEKSEKTQVLVEQTGAEVTVKTMDMDLAADKTLVSDESALEPTVANPLPPLTAVNRLDKLQPGTIFAQRYKILKSLGAGAMGVVYLAKDLELEEPVALKIMLSSGLNEADIERFKQEIRLARKITHRNILRTFDFGAVGPVHFITMEYVHGFDLNELITKQGRLEPRIALLMARQICSAVAAAHEQGIIHRDLKPHNMMINRQGILKIMDFGLAMRVARPIISRTGETAAGVEGTQGSGGVAGTPSYMSPEQFAGDELDVRADIYAIGVILFKMFTGSTPYSGRTIAELAEKHTQAPIPVLSQVAPYLPPELKVLDGIIAQAMAKDREQRFKQVQALQAALQQISL